MIIGFVGLPGSGKTYTMTRLALKRAKKYKHIASNFEIKNLPKGCQFIPLEDPQDLLELEGLEGKCLVVLSEAHVWFPARKSMQLPMSMQMKLSQTRHDGLDLWWDAQHESKVDRYIRDVTNFFYVCRGYLPSLNWRAAGAPLIFVMKSFRPEDMGKKKRKPMTRSYSMFSMKVAGSYDTLRSIAVAKHLVSKKDEYAAAKGGNRYVGS